MSEFKFVQWGLGVPVDYQRLNAMMLNEDYVRQLAEPAPRGIIAWRSVSGSTYSNPTGIMQDVSGLNNISFTVESGRAISFEFQSGGLYSPSTQVELRFGLLIDAVPISDISSTVLPVGSYEPSIVYTWFPTTALTAGSHTVSAQFVSNNAASSIQIGRSSRCELIVRDEGIFTGAV
jgi:hypothetical protein